MRRHDAALRPLGLSMGQLPVLIALQERGPLSQKDLAAIAHVEQPSMAELLARMERDGIVDRTVNPDDRRGSMAKLTRGGRARLVRAQAALIANEQTALAGFSATEKALLIALLSRVRENVAAPAAQPHEPGAPTRQAPPRRPAAVTSPTVQGAVPRRVTKKTQPRAPATPRR